MKSMIRNARTIFSLLIAILLQGTLMAQEVEADFKDKKFKAETQIMKLKTGAVVFLVKNNSKSIEAYRKSGKLKLAEELEVKQKERNQSVIIGFNKYFDYCKYYFLHIDDLASFNSGKREGIFLNASLVKDPGIKMTENYFLFVDRGRVEERQYGEKSGTGTTTTGDALVVKDANRNTLQTPFPFYVKMYIKENINPKKVLRLNELLHNYYRNVTRKK